MGALSQGLQSPYWPLFDEEIISESHGTHSIVGDYSMHSISNLSSGFVLAFTLTFFIPLLDEQLFGLHSYSSTSYCFAIVNYKVTYLITYDDLQDFGEQELPLTVIV